jgi:transcription-repair coupling factor (superfamily II helicase)
MDLSGDKTVLEIISRLKAAKGSDRAVKVEGTWGSFAPLLAAYISTKLKRPILYISPHIDDADNCADDLQSFTELVRNNENPPEKQKRATQLETFPAWEAEGGPDSIGATDETGIERLRIALGLAGLREADRTAAVSELIVSASIQAICQPIPRIGMLKQKALRLEVGSAISPEKVLEWLIENGFERVDRVEAPGHFAHRGGIVDIYAPLTAERSGPGGKFDSRAVRIEFFGDTVESVRSIDLDTQRSYKETQSVTVIPPAGDGRGVEDELFISVLPENTIVILEEPIDIEEVAGIFLDRVERPQRLYKWRDIYKAIENFTQLQICRFPGSAGDKDEYLKMDIGSADRFEHKAGPIWSGNKAVLKELADAAKKNKVFLYCQNAAEAKRISEIITAESQRMPANLNLPVGFIHRGFTLNSLNTIIVSHHEIFGQYAIRRRIRKIRPTSPVDNLLDLQRGDYVVHVSHGIAKFAGMKTIKKKGQTSEYLTLEYANKTYIHVPVQNIGLVQKYVGTMVRRPALSKVGTRRWQRQKERAARAVQDLASELLELQAKRETMGGITFGEDTNWQRQFEESFAYIETPDQITVSEQIKADMQRPIPMERLVCGDVGYGKTELAMRAAFKAVEHSKQVAVLVPTTVLCVQHGRTFGERFADFPIGIETLTRFKTPKQAKEIIKRTKQGRVDILIGTHRLLSNDVGFKDLAFLIIDEEQRFGVEHKERLKRIRTNIDVLTMTATPIPRTLHLSLLGIRDISSLVTPPLDRRSIVTTVCRYDKGLIKRAILRELNRQGQVFFLHNRVGSIARVADELRELVPDTRIAIGHGQMPKHELEKVMIDFVLGEVDVLVCTTIIESGLDIPNANTIFINDADRFGLAELHQLRGRVGRYKHRAYAYLLLPARRTITPKAVKRLKAIEEYSHLGAGFRIALRDLEIRGAGNILGAEQSGHIQAVGYEMYCKLLAEAVRHLKNQPTEPQQSTVIDLGFSTYIPKNYIPDDRQRIDVYRRLSAVKSMEDLKQLEKDLADLFGPIPQEVDLLLQWVDLRVRVSRYQHIGLKSIVALGQDLIFSFDSPVGESRQVGTHGEAGSPRGEAGSPRGEASRAGPDVSGLFERAPGIVRVPDVRTVHIRLEKSYFEPRTLLSVLRKIFSR